MVMGTGASGNSFRGHRDRIRPRRRLKEARSARVSWLDLEGLETRALMATIPAATPTGNLQDLSAMMGNLGGTGASINSEQVAVDPQDSSKVVAVWVDNDPTMAAATDDEFFTVLEAAYSLDGGKFWLPLFSEPTNTADLREDTPLLDATTTVGLPYAYVSGPSLGFDNDNNFYMLDEYQDAPTAAGSATGAVVLQKFDFSTTTPTITPFFNNEQDPSPYPGAPNNLKIIYQWYTSANNDQAIDPTMTVDDNQATLPPSVNSPIDPTSGNVYVSWTSLDIVAASDKTDPTYNPDRIFTTVSSDGGNNFGPVTLTDANVYKEPDDVNDEPVIEGPYQVQGPGNDVVSNGPDVNSAITVSQGRAPSESGLTDDPGIPGGQVAVTWDYTGSNTLMANTLSPGHDSSFGEFAAKTIPIGSYATGGTPIPITVSLSNITDLDSLDVRVDVVAPSGVQYLGLYLVAPSGQVYELFQNETVFKNTPDPFVGLPSGTAVGVQVNPPPGDPPYYEVGTIFDDNATRNIVDLVPGTDGSRGGGGGTGRLYRSSRGTGLRDAGQLPPAATHPVRHQWHQRHVEADGPRLRPQQHGHAGRRLGLVAELRPRPDAAK
jgi:hypothetical protein